MFTRRSRNRKQSNILKRLTMLFAVLVLPIVTVGILIQIRSASQIQDNILSSSAVRIADHIQSIDDSIARTKEQASSVLSDVRVRRIANPKDPMSAYDRAVNVNYIRDLMSNIQYGNPHVSSIRLYLPALSLSYNTIFSYKTDNSFRGSQAIMSDTLYQQLLSFRETPQKSYIHDQNMVFVQYSSLRSPQAIIEMIYVEPELQDMFRQTLLYDDSFYFFSLPYEEFQVTNCEHISVLSALQSVTAAFGESGVPMQKLRIDGVSWYAFSAVSHETGGIYTQMISEDQLFMNTEFSIQYSIIFTCTVIVFSFAFILGAFRIVHTPVQELSASLRQIEEEHFDTRLDMPATSDFQYLYESFNAMSDRLSHLIQQELQHEILLNRAQLKQLQAQINPHFLYNSFFMLNQMIARDMQEESQELSSQLGNYFKYITRNFQDEMALADEYEHTKTYASIQLKRFYGRIQIQMEELPPAFASLPVPRLILQPLLENAFQYGLENKIRNGLLRVSFTASDSSAEERALSILIEDNGEELTDETLKALQNTLAQIGDSTFCHETTGLFNICKRLQLYYKRSDCMQLSRSGLGGLKIKLTFYEKEDSHVPTADC